MDKLNTPAEILSGFLLILFTVLPMMAIIAYWPDMAPANHQHAFYDHSYFHTRLITNPKITSGIDLNLILFILVTCSGFLGSMIHISTSFTTFVGAEKFEKSWILWYCTKPFTGAALALVFYFALRAGLLNVNSDNAGSINLYGTMALAMFTGLFTDVATQKLKEIFQVLFQPKDQRPDKLNEQLIITSVSPDELHIGKMESITVIGKGLHLKQLDIQIGNNRQTAYTLSGEISLTFNYQVPANSTTGDHLVLKIVEAGTTRILYSKSMKII